MNYPLENLDPERFQQLCQSLITKETPGVQCFPVAQPDGGRDAIAYIAHDGKRTQFAIYQVKFVRNPHVEKDIHKWLADIVALEAPKIRQLVPKGASQFTLITNVSGTAHPGSGTIDKVSVILEAALDVPAACWWRDDVSRRLDNAWDLKWMYPEIMTGPDFLRAIIESGLKDESERRTSTIRSFLRHQYDLDEEVRFKQVELQNRLLDLFVDVPISIRDEGGRKRAHNFQRAVIGATQPGAIDESLSEYADPETFRLHSQGHQVGAASLLLGSQTPTLLPNVVVEGAPGQGKSTITQYVCQVHRMKLLSVTADIASIPQFHRSATVRLPIRVDLRDFATWLSHENPFSADETQTVPAGWTKSLESFLAALISNQAGGAAFTVDDLLALCRLSSVTLVFDGLDEVADIARRKDVVDELTRGIQRLGENCASLQTIITSRPAAFANSPGMPERKFTYLQLLSLSLERITEYGERWIRARRFDGRLASEFRRLLKTRLDQPHLRDLARNPMQLAILLSLIHTRGASLPDKRTALYYFYIDLFFSRESEKSPVVRDHREILIDLHGYLGWALHAEAEKGDSRASISAERLKQLVATYLEKEGHDPALASQLFTGVVERVVALVSRVEGTFEFEVQPMREYFAACFLFNTAPPSSPGRERPGTRPDRFDALARNFYWLNVTRFYAGCYSKGELPSLVERLQELCRETGYSRIGDPRALTATLLADWVFAQNPRSVQQAVDLVLDGIGLRRLLADTWRYRSHLNITPLALPRSSGRDQLVARCFALLDDKPPDDFALDVIELLKVNTTSPQDYVEAWRLRMAQAASNNDSKSAERWAYYGLHLGVLSTCSLAQLEEAVGRQTVDPRQIASLLRARRTDYLEHTEETFDASVATILGGTSVSLNDRKAQSSLEVLADICTPHRYSACFGSRQPVPLATLIAARRHRNDLRLYDPSALRAVSYRGHDAILGVAAIVERERARPATEWAIDLSPWERVVEALRSNWGETRAVLKLATIAAGIKSQTERCTQASDLFDDAVSLCRRMRFARLRSANASFWSQNFSRSSTNAEKLRLLLVALTWASPATLVSTIEALSNCLDSLSARDWHWLFYSARQCRLGVRADTSPSKYTFDLLASSLRSGISTRAACTLADLLPDDKADRVYRTVLADRWDEDPIVLEFAQKAALDLPNLGLESWRPNLQIVRRCYERGEEFEPREFAMRLHRDRFTMPYDVAKAVADDPMAYPGYFVRLADDRCRQEVAGKVVPLLDAAERGHWFAP